MINSPVGAPVSIDHSGTPMLLRPSETTEDPISAESKEDESYRILSHHKFLQLSNKHCADHECCSGLLFWNRDAEIK